MGCLRYNEYALVLNVNYYCIAIVMITDLDLPLKKRNSSSYVQHSLAVNCYIGMINVWD